MAFTSNELITDELVTKNDDCIAALDIGSNSFHFVLARIVDDHIQILHSEKHRVQLATGLNSENILSQQAIERGLAALTILAKSTQLLTPENFRIVATYTLRTARNAHQFLIQAAKILPFDIEVISGHEEARLIYQGVSHYNSLDEQRLVLDIGGGSTECIIGKNNDIFTLDSMNIGCVSFANNHFPDTKITKLAFENAILQASLEIEAISARFKKVGWKSVLGTSGTIKSIYNIINANNDLPQPITLKHLNQLKAELIAAGDIENLAIKELKESRKAIICPGLAILIALVEVFAIKQLDFCDYSLREGVLLGQLQTKQAINIHDRTIASLTTRFNIDLEQTQRIKTTANIFFEQCKKAWHLNNKKYIHLLEWVIDLHEIGLDINTSAYHKHSKYIIENADLPGFNQEQIQAIAWLVGNHRRKIMINEELSWFLLSQEKLNHLLVIIRLACLLNKQRQLAVLPEMIITTESSDSIQIAFPHLWLVDHPLLLADLQQEQLQYKLLNLTLNIKQLPQTESE